MHQCEPLHFLPPLKKADNNRCATYWISLTLTMEMKTISIFICLFVIIQGKISTGDKPLSPKSCFCPRISSKVCGSDGKTYLNSCLAKCARVDVDCKGKCPCVMTRGEFVICTVSKQGQEPTKLDSIFLGLYVTLEKIYW